jgi:hypothetical protein
MAADLSNIGREPVVITLVKQLRFTLDLPLYMSWRLCLPRQYWNKVSGPADIIALHLDY